MPLDQPPRLTDPNLWVTAPNMTFTITSNGGAFVTVSEKGDVTIDWDAVRTAADQPEHTEWWAIATALLKAREACKKPDEK